MEVARFLLICIFFDVLSIISTATVRPKWAKYRHGEESVEAICTRNKTWSMKDGVSDAMSCGRFCYVDNINCSSILFQPEKYECVGCQDILKHLPSTPSGFIHYSIRNFDLDCKDIIERNAYAESGIYKITLHNFETLEVYCDMTTDSGGWTEESVCKAPLRSQSVQVKTVTFSKVPVFQKRFDGSSTFRKTFSEYVNGFGDLNGEFWLDLKIIQELTEMSSELRYDVSYGAELTLYERYRNFKILGETYILYIDKLLERPDSYMFESIDLASFNGSQFATFDSLEHCADYFGGGWWYSPSFCAPYINLNIMYPTYSVVFGETEPVEQTLETSRMMFRRN